MKIQPQVGNCHGEAPELLCDLGDHILMEMREPHPEQDAWLLRVGGTGPPSQSKVAGYSLGRWPTGILWILSRLRCGYLRGRLEPG